MPLLETDPVCFAREDDGDVAFPLRLLAGLDAAAVGGKVRSQLVRGEVFTDTTVGIPYLPTDDGTVTERRAILGQPHDPGRVRQAFLQELLTVPGARDVPLLNSVAGEERSIDVEWQLRTAFGDTPVTATEVEV